MSESHDSKRNKIALLLQSSYFNFNGYLIFINILCKRNNITCLEHHYSSACQVIDNKTYVFLFLLIGAACMGVGVYNA